ncbi:hypothetical protein [Lentzea cavernae]|uniref:Uncharacterized protein n=1 Tax=Lentzea cavernae TaxID=2020703 RepID=A0ABQ3MQD2_9PSEU|nr:hypothetical protein [Lentzea cavernae]GHH57723.1 hypothetical protein GCM10017774_77780 [Lentzea cavernae]
MTKRSGLGSVLYYDGNDLSGDKQTYDISCPMSPFDVTPINKFAPVRIGGRRDGAMNSKSFFNPATDQAHDVEGALLLTDRAYTIGIGDTIGSAAACLVSKQIGYDPTRTAEGELTFNVDAQGNGYGLEWGELLTAGARTDTAATNGPGVDYSAATSFGAQFYLHVLAFAGTDVTIKLQDSADNASFADLAAGAFASVTAAKQSQRIQTARNATVRRYLRVATTTTGGFTSVSFVVAAIKNTFTVNF